jgi:HSP20 family protein
MKEAVVMLTRWDDFGQTLQLMNEMRRRMERVFGDFETDATRGAGTAWPRAQLWDRGESLVVMADVPGLTEKDLKLTVNAEVMTSEGERRLDAPQGYSAHRQERIPARFARSLAFPCKVNVEKVAATVKDGVLTVTLPKAPESQPRQIAVRAS